jgi:mannitol-1-phosphate/altronate dehydrogenase
LVYTAQAENLKPGDRRIYPYSLSNKTFGPDNENISILDIHTKSLVGLAQISTVIDRIANPDTKIVSLTVSEAGYYILQLTNSRDISVDDVTNDSQGGAPRMVYEILKGALLER